MTETTPEQRAARPPLGSAERPLRVVVIGSSATFMMTPMSADPDDGVYAEWLPDLLLARGVHAEVIVHSKWHTTVAEVMPHFEPWIRDHFPDVVIFNLGGVDCQPHVVPTWLLRNTLTWLPGQSGVSQWYRRRIVPTLRTRVRRVQQLLSAPAGLRLSRVPPARFQRSMDRLVRMSSKDNGAYVIVIDIDPVGDKVEYWMPGQNARVRAYNEILERVTVGHQGRASFIPASRVILENGPEIQPDGLHRSAKAHQLVAQLIADELLAQATSVGIRRQLSDA